MVEALSEHFASGKFERVLVLHIVAHKINQELAWLVLPAIKLEWLEAEDSAFVELVSIQNQSAAEIYGFQNVCLARRIGAEQTNRFQDWHTFPLHQVMPQFASKCSVDIGSPEIYPYLLSYREEVLKLNFKYHYAPVFVDLLQI